MPFARPTLQELIDRVDAEIESRLGVGPLRPRSVLAVLARVLAGSSHLLHGHLDWIADQVFPDTAELEQLERWAAIWGIQRKAATFAQGDVDFTGTNGTDIPAGTLLQRADGRQYTTDSLATIAGGTATAAVTAVLPGAAGNAAAATPLTLASPIAGVSSSAAVAAGGLAGGADQESDADLRARLLLRIQEPPQGGAAIDYARWALEVPDVDRVWVFPLQSGVGYVDLTFSVTAAAGGPIPAAPKVAEVQAYVDERRPVTAVAQVFAPALVALDPEISITPDTAAVRAAVQASLEDLLRREAVPGGTLLLSHIHEAISTAAGETDHVLVSPAADVVYAPGELGELGTITWS